MREQRETSLQIYAHPGPPLAVEFPWRGLEAGPGGDKLYRKRPHRFAFAPQLALASLYGEATAPALAEIVSDWMVHARSRDNDVCYDSNLAVIERLLALSWAWAFLAARESPSVAHLEQETLVLKVIHSDIEFLLPRLGSSFANNHLLGDVFAGWFIGCVWPELGGGDETRKRFEPLWLRELSRQILNDGTSFEHSTHYHEYACEMVVAYVLLSRLNGYSLPDWTVTRARRMLEFQAVLAGAENETLVIGDATEDPLFPLDCGSGWGTAAWREIYRSVFGARLAPSVGDAPSRERAYWLLGGALAEEAKGREAPPALVAFPNGGFYVLNDAWVGSRLVFRTGPAEGEAVAPGHTHSDLLSVYWSEQGRPLTVDAGAYTYCARGPGWPPDEPDWRGYLRGAGAHNGLEIDGLDALGKVERRFRHGTLASFVAVDKAEDTDGLGWVDARVTGGGAYASHRRGVVRVQGVYFVVYDVVPALGETSRAALGLQFSPEVEIERRGLRGLGVRDREITAFVMGSTGLEKPELRCGSRDPIGGWVSPRYGELVPAPQARFAVRDETTAASFVLGHGSVPDEAEVEVHTLDGRGLRIAISLGDIDDTLLVNFGSADEELSDGEVTFRGGVAWFRRRGGVASQLRWLNGTHFIWRDQGVVVSGVEPASGLQIESRGETLSVDYRDPASLSTEWPFRS